MEQWIGSKLGKEYIKAVYCHLAYLTYIYADAALDESQAGIKTVRRNNNNFRYADYTTIIVESQDELKSL